MDRFWDKVDKSGDCWLWTGAKGNQMGYGMFNLNGTKRAHRVSWEICFGSIPKGLCVLHKCDVPLCVNPDHLFLGSNADNSRDKVDKGRSAKGEKINTAKLTKEDVIWIRELGASHRRIAKCFGVDKSQISRIKAKKTWGHV